MHHAVVPARFLSLTAHLVLTITLYWSRVSHSSALLSLLSAVELLHSFCIQEPHISACTSSDTNENSSEYKNKDLQYVPKLAVETVNELFLCFCRLLLALSFTLLCTVVEFGGFFLGLSMFTSLPSIFCILSLPCHFKYYTLTHNHIILAELG